MNASTVASTAESTPPLDLLSTPFLIGNVGAPFAIGMAVGYFAKKMFRIALFIGGALVVLLFVAEYYDLITVSDEKLQQAATTATQAVVTSGEALVQRLTRITSRGVSAAGGFFVGLRIG